MASSGGLNPFAQSGFAKSAAYDQHRPSFPSESVNLLLENIRLEGNKNATVVDLAAGTGKFTELLAKRDEAFDITAVEPHADMRRVLEEKKLPGVQVKDGLSTSMPFEDESVDAVIAAQVGYRSFCVLLKRIYTVRQRCKGDSRLSSLSHRRFIGSRTWIHSERFIACCKCMAPWV